MRKIQARVLPYAGILTALAIVAGYTGGR